VRDFHNLTVWQKAHRLTLAVYAATRTFPSEELYGLTSQTRRSSASIAANIAEGCGRTGAKQFARFLDIALGSASELQYHLLLGRDLHLLDNASYEQLTADVQEIKKMLTSFIQKLRPDRRKADS